MLEIDPRDRQTPCNSNNGIMDKYFTFNIFTKITISGIYHNLQKVNLKNNVILKKYAKPCKYYNRQVQNILFQIDDPEFEFA
jgi:hypothetical protein